MQQDNFLKNIGGKVKAIRKANNLSQEKLAELAGLHPTYISEIERGKVNASIYSFYKVATALEIPFSELVNIPSADMDRKIENEIAVILGQLRALGKRKQLVFLSAAKGLIGGVEKS